MKTLADVSRQLAREVEKLRFSPPVAYVYNPLIYAREPHERFLERWGTGPKEVVLIGMNPGPFGMAQIGVPFGQVELSKTFLGIDGFVGKPPREHPARPIEGFACKRSEVSGARVWGWVQERFTTPQKFFARFFVINYCPLVFMEESGKNITPDKLSLHEREALHQVCDKALRASIELLAPKFVVGVGAYAAKRANVALEGLEVKIGSMLHPSPASPKANLGWAKQAEADLRALGISLP